MRRSLLPIVSVFLTQVFFLSIIVSGSDAKTQKTNLTPIEHVLILMLENRSFDHMLGFLKQVNPDINGCLPNDSNCSNPLNTTDPSSNLVTVDDQAIYVQTSPSHSIDGTTQQIYGSKNVDTKNVSPTMNGFISSYTAVTGSADAGATVMKCFNSEHLPVLSNLTLEYAVFDSWFASIPGPTMPNRAYAGSATSHGQGYNDEVAIAKGFPQKTMFRQILDMGLDYRIYFETVPTVLQFKDMRHKVAREKYHGIKKFYEDVSVGDLPELTWIEPNFFTTNTIPADDQHPDHDVSLGEQLIANVYNALRNSPIWNTSALIITYDEHGGFFDHVPPVTNIPNPDGINYVDDSGNVLFDFTRIGVRIPTVVVSPWVKKGKVIHNDDTEPTADGYNAPQYEHSSTIATIVHKMFQPKLGRPKPEFLTKRDAWAKTFESIFLELSEPRTDCIERASQVRPQQEVLMEEGKGKNYVLRNDGSGPLNDLQLELLTLVAGTTNDTSFKVDVAMRDWTENDGAKYCQLRLNEYFGRLIVQAVKV